MLGVLTADPGGVVVAVVFMFLAVRLLNDANNPGYRCPQCGTRRQGEHGEGCSWG